MRVCTSRFLVPFALGVMGLGVLLLAGCGEGSPQAGEASAPVAEVSPATMQKLETLRGERVELAGLRQRVVAQMKAMVDAKRAAMKGADDAAVKAALEKDAEWVSLYKRWQDLNAAIGEKRQAAAGEVRKELAPNGKISK